MARDRRKRLRALRRAAFAQQGGYCWYCRLAMWERGYGETRAAAMCRMHLATGRALSDRVCTAEHLIRRCDGGRLATENIVAACARCNSRRGDAEPCEFRANQPSKTPMRSNSSLTSGHAPPHYVENLRKNIVRSDSLRSRGLQQILTKELPGRTASDVDQRCRALRRVKDDAVKPLHGIRGRAAPHLSISEALLHILAMVPGRPSEVERTAVRLSTDCKYVRFPLLTAEEDRFSQGRTFAEALAMSFYQPMPSWKRFEVTEDGRLAWLVIQPAPLGAEFRLLFTSDFDQFIEGSLMSSERDDASVMAEYDRYVSIDAKTNGSRFVVNVSWLAALGSIIAADSPREIDRSLGRLLGEVQDQPEWRY